MIDNPHRPEEQGLSPLKPNRQLTVLIACFVIAVIFWMLQALSSQYAATISFPVDYRNLPKKKVVVNELPASVAVQLKTTGFKILTYELSGRRDTVSIDVAAGISNSASVPGALSVPTRYFLQDFTRQLGDDVVITGFRPDSIVLLFNERITRRLPVKLDVGITLMRQYDTVGAPMAIPDSMEVSGPPAVVRKLKYVKTLPLKFDQLKQSVLQSVDLDLPPLVIAASPNVKVSIPVEEFTEGKLEIPVRTTMVPSGYVLKIFPEIARVRYQVPLSRFNEVEVGQFEVIVDASGLPSSSVTVLPLRLVKTSPLARNFIMDPSEVEFILRKK